MLENVIYVEKKSILNSGLWLGQVFLSALMPNYV